MKILAFVDVHGNKTALNKIIEKSKNADLLVCAGDITNFGQGLNKTVNLLSKTNKPLLIIPGNHETASEIKSLKQEFIINIHKTLYRIDDYIFFGYGSGGFSLRDIALEKITKEIKQIVKNKKFILVTHAPPYGTTADTINGQHHGSVSITKMIYETSPIINICGHLHETANKKSILRKTLIINPGPYGTLINI